MNKHGLIGLLMLTMVGAVSGQEKPIENRFRVGLSYRPAFNISADFRNLGGFPALTAPGPAAGGGIDRFYDNGFVRVDISGNAGGQTWFWGYTSAAQVPGNDTIVMNSSSAPSSGTSQGDNDDPQHGFELTGSYAFGEGDNWRWGLECGLGFTAIGIGNNLSFSAPVTIISDAFALNGLIPPVPPYSGTFAGPGPLIGDSPTRTVAVIPGGAITTGQRRLDGELYSLKLGPYIEVPVWQRLKLSLSGGLAVGFVDNRFSVSESTTIAGVGTVSAVARTSRCDALVGGYIGANFIYDITDRCNVFIGAQYQHVGIFRQQTAGREASLNLGKTVFATIGVGYSF